MPVGEHTAATITLARQWYASPACRELFAKTLNGRLMFMWEAELDDGGILRQFEEIPFQRALTDPNFVLPADIRLSTDIIPRDKVVRFSLRPTALTKRFCPWFAQADYTMTENVDPKNEDLIAKWLVDHHIQGAFGQMEIARQVVGKKLRASPFSQFLRVLSPSGAIFAGDREDQSYEGE
jgi:hypothetical protein